jgi:hypothetical protein
VHFGVQICDALQPATDCADPASTLVYDGDGPLLGLLVE